jgi:hypothetical protein
MCGLGKLMVIFKNTDTDVETANLGMAFLISK